LVACRRKLAKNEIADLACLFRESPLTTILDVGANVGFMSWQFAKTFPQATVYALEPDPTPRHVFQKTHGTNPQIRIFPIAAADRDGELAFVQRKVSCNSSLLGIEGQPDSDAKSTRVKATTLDRFCLDQSIGHINLLKTDTEGADLLVLRGAKRMLGCGCIDVVMSEVLFVPIYEGQATFDEIAGFLKGYGYMIFNVYVGRETPIGQACYANAIFTSSTLRQRLAKPN
jgi:FkbM family methyltransferase